MKLIILLAVTYTFFVTACDKTNGPKRSFENAEGELIPSSNQENANYYLIKVERDGVYLRTLHSRISSMNHGYSYTLIDCESRRYQDLGYVSDSQENIKLYDDLKWTELFTGSSKSDLVSFVCEKTLPISRI